MVTFDRISEAHPAAIAGALSDTAVAHHVGESAEHALAAHNAATLTALALQAGHASLDAHLAGTAVDAGGLLPDVQVNNSWTQTVGEVDPLELLEVQLCNSIAPFLLVSRLRPALAPRRATATSGRAYVVNVSAMEGQFSRRYKGAGHPHTNMAKAALNMLTRTSSGEMFETDRILMTAVDTGWITDERPHQEKLRIAAEGWHAPLDLVDGAARVYDPIVLGEAGDRPVRLLREGLPALALVTLMTRPMSRLETAEEFHARVAAATDDEGRLPVAIELMPGWDIFPFELDGLRIKPLEPLLDAEPPRHGEDPADCACQQPTHARAGCPRRVEQRALGAHRARHAAAGGPDPPAARAPRPRRPARRPRLRDGPADGRDRRRPSRSLPSVGRCHVGRYGDGSAHLHPFFFGRPARMPQLRGSCLLDWEENLPDVPDDVRRANAATSAAAGRAGSAATVRPGSR